MALDEARFGLMNWPKRRYCPKGIRPVWTVRRVYEWTWLYAAIAPATGQDFCLYLPRLEGSCYEVFLKHLSQGFPHELILLIQDNAPAHINHKVSFPENIIPIPLPSYSPELNPVERWFLALRRALANRCFDSLEALEAALTDVLKSFWLDPDRLKQLTNFPWWHQAVEKL